VQKLNLLNSIKLKWLKLVIRVGRSFFLIKLSHRAWRRRWRRSLLCRPMVWTHLLGVQTVSGMCWHPNTQASVRGADIKNI